MDPLLVSGVIAVGLLLAASSKKKKRTTPTPTPEPTPEPAPAPKPGQDKTDADMLRTLGYSSTPTGIEAFQREFNVVQNVYKIWDRLLKPDGIMGTNTRGALIRAIAYAKQQGDSWEDIVNAAKVETPENQLKPNDKGNLNNLGYSTKKSDVVQSFQEDFNVVNLWHLDEYGDAMIPATLDEDNLMGPLTREAIAYAQDLQNKLAKAWPNIVKTAQANA